MRPGKLARLSNVIFYKYVLAETSKPVQEKLAWTVSVNPTAAAWQRDTFCE